MIQSLRKHAWKPVAFCALGYVTLSVASFSSNNINLEDALSNNNGNIDTACKSHLSALRITQMGHAATTSSMTITKTPPPNQKNMNQCKEEAKIIIANWAP
ncbi:MAG: hypothetical protein JKY11_06290 [Alphaproteobacteria bacterium]|nr:hypothetical protein [Alphaproteobacteria bacterium]